MDRQIESNCLGLLENYRTLAAGNRMEFTEMVLACAGIYLAAGASPDMERRAPTGRRRRRSSSTGR